MSTFTMQDLNLPMTAEEAIQAVDAIKQAEAIKALEQHEKNHAWVKVVRDYQEVGQTIADNSRLEAQQASEPQPTLGTCVPSIDDIVATISQQLALLATVITQTKGNSQAEDQSLQDCVSLTLQQAEWFKEMVEQQVDKRDFDELVTDAVSDRVETEVDNYFDGRFDPTDHFDFGDAVQDAVSDQIEDVVRDRLDDVVQEQLEELVAEKLKGMRIIFD